MDKKEGEPLDTTSECVIINEVDTLEQTNDDILSLEYLVDELSTNRKDHYDILNKIVDFRNTIDINFKLDKNSYRVKDKSPEKIRAVVDIIKAELDIRKNIDTSIKSEIEIRRKLNNDRKPIDDKDEDMFTDTSELRKLTKALRDLKNSD